MLSTHLWVNLAQSEAIHCSVFSTDASSRNPDGMVRGSPTIQASGKGICPILLSQSIEAQRIFYAYRRVDSLCHSLSFSSTGTRFQTLPQFLNMSTCWTEVLDGLTVPIASLMLQGLPTRFERAKRNGANRWAKTTYGSLGS